MPILGLTADHSMMKIADSSMLFFKGAELEHHINFYSLENLKGGFISIIIGVLVYVLIVDKFMIKDDRYLDLWPKKLDLEDLVYRPLLLDYLPSLFGGLSAVFANNLISKEIYGSLLKMGSFSASLFADNIVSASHS